MGDTTADSLTWGQQQALNELGRIDAINSTALEIVQVHPGTAGGLLPIEISLTTAGMGLPDTSMPATGPRAHLHARERFIIYVPPQFPFMRPEVRTPHERFAHLAHVQWRRVICLYLSPSTEWNPADGMFGLLERLVAWLEQAANGALDPVGAPLHPPIAYPSAAGGVAVIRASAPSAAGRPWLGYAVFAQSDGMRADLVGWLSAGDAERLLAAPSRSLLTALTGVDADHTPIRFGLAVLLSEPTTFEFPDQAQALFDMLVARGVSNDALLDHLARMAHLNRQFTSAPLAARRAIYLVVGTPMRGMAGGERQQHVAVWRLPSELQVALPYLEPQVASGSVLREQVTQFRAQVSEWLKGCGIDWARVFEARPEITVRRDQGSPLEWARGRTIAIIGCGALGGAIAEHLTRAGAARLLLMDDGFVSPGVLVRQPYNDDDIGKPKVNALSEHVHRMGKSLNVELISLDALRVILNESRWPPDVDLIVDAAANPTVTAALERQRRRHTDTSPPLLSLLIGHTAHRAVATLAPRGYSGGGVDLLRKMKLSALDAPDLQSFADEFFPDPPRTTYFQPEPGCSEATFVGSHAEVAALTASLLTHALAILSAAPAAAPADPANAHAILMDLGLGRSPALLRRLSWPTDWIRCDEAEDLDVRIAPSALAEMRAECRLMARRRSWDTETGGVLLGEIDEACGVAWISMTSGPPPDSRASRRLFVCGVEGVEAFVQQHNKRTRGAMQFLGLWHSHPGGQAAPSNIDEEGMRELVAPIPHAPPSALLVILGEAPRAWKAWLRAGEDSSQSAQSAQSAQSSPQVYTRRLRQVRGSDATDATDRVATAAKNAYVHALATADERETRRWPLTSGVARPTHQSWSWWGRRRRRHDA